MSKIIMKKQPSNYEYFLKLDTASYKGKWIAIARNKVAAVDMRADEAFKIAKKKFPTSKISLAKVPPEETLIAKFGTNDDFYQERQYNYF